MGKNNMQMMRMEPKKEKEKEERESLYLVSVKNVFSRNGMIKEMEKLDDGCDDDDDDDDDIRVVMKEETT